MYELLMDKSNRICARRMYKISMPKTKILSREMKSGFISASSGKFFKNKVS